MKTLQKKQKGFTLIEIAIVLVIIGLLLGGILKGQELITQAKIRNVANDFTGVSAAYYAYQDRYRAIPGDDQNAAARWTIPIPTGGTLGNGIVEGNYSDTGSTNSEAQVFWRELRLSGLIAGATTDTNPPQNALSGITGVQSPTAGTFGLSGLVVCSSNLPAKVAQAIDSQFDDGNATTGQVRAAVTIGSAKPTTNYVDDGATSYIVCKDI